MKYHMQLIILITDIQNIQSTTTQNVNKKYNNNNTDFMYQRTNTNYNYDNRRRYILQQHFLHIKEKQIQ